MIPKLRRSNKSCICNRCGHGIPKGEYYAEVPVVIAVPLCKTCVYLNKATIYALPSEFAPGELNMFNGYVQFPAIAKGETK